ncbi:MAG: hypothetical protein LBO74_17760 [Candidatus Symbiothrix sp.]|nr:hypothetical protein [Candidatus Symbiothrix sp.]
MLCFAGRYWLYKRKPASCLSIRFDAKGVKGVAESLPKIPLPAIAHVIRKNLQHYVVIYTFRCLFF